MKKGLFLLLAILASLPVGWISAMLLTPVLWRLEPILGIELAGHSGPSDWVIAMTCAVFAIGLAALFRRFS